jgi:6-phosphogluconolactonase/glucosamine-6-phosphate isomerase/deaminase
MGVEFRKITTTEPVASYLAEVILNRLRQNQRVLWFATGGSGIQVAAQVSAYLHGQDLSRLTITITDERHGLPGHQDSNWQQLLDAGFQAEGATLLPILDGTELAESAANWNTKLVQLLKESDYRIGLFGVGADGHTAGILPSSPAVDTAKFAIGYESSPYRRITITPIAISKLDEAVVYMVGEAKRPILDQLDDFIPIMQQPAQALKVIPQVTIFNDSKGVAG